MVTYACETWTLKKKDIQKLLIFERKILRKIFGPKKCVDGTWIIRTNDELNKIIKNKNIVNYIRGQRLAWFGHVCRMSEDRIVKKLFQWKPLTTRCQGRPKIRWEDDVIEDLKKMKVKNWISCVHDRKRWKKEVVEKAKAFNQ
ncbi:hypothetical protein C0J52_12965 [Blattella germanica]|nr:hypothetical protein C0J52_12965 [Blattella germanica]PSN44285.1 hypothetical protein C0J52_12965 [Blattella germanica]